MITPVERHLVDKKFVIKDGKEYFKLYFYDMMDGIVVSVLAPIIERGVQEDTQEFYDYRIGKKQILPNNEVSE